MSSEQQQNTQQHAVVERSVQHLYCGTARSQLCNRAALFQGAAWQWDYSNGDAPSSEHTAQRTVLSNSGNMCAWCLSLTDMMCVLQGAAAVACSDQADGGGEGAAERQGAKSSSTGSRCVGL